MAQIDYLVSIQMNQNQLLLPVIHNTTSAPGTPVEGQLYANTTSNKLFYHDGSNWIDLTSTIVVDGDYGDITVSSTGTVWTIDNSVVTLAKMSDIATNTFLGRTTATTGVVEVLTTTQATAMLNVFTSGLKGLVPASGGGSTIFLNADGGFSTPGGGFANFDAGGDINVNQTVDTGDVLDIVGGTGVETTVTKATTIITLSVALAAMAANTIKGNPTAGSLAPADISLGTNTVLGRIAGNIQAITIDSDLSSVSGSDDTLASAKAIKAAIDSAVTNGMNYLGAFDPTANVGAGNPDLDAITSSIGDTYTVTVAGTYNWTTGSAILEIGDMLIAEANGVLNNVNQWTIINRNLDGVVIGPSSAVDSHVALFDGTTGELIKDGGTLMSNVVNASETVKGIVEEATDSETAAGTATGATGAKLFVTPTKLQTELGNVLRKVTDTCDADTSTTVTHNFGTRNVLVEVYRTGTPWDTVIAEIKRTTINTVDVNFNVAPTLSEFTIIVTG